MTVSTFGARIRGLLRLRREPTLPPYPPQPATERTPVRTLTAEELGRYDLRCRELHGGPAPIAGTVHEQIPPWGRAIVVYDLTCPRGHDYQYKRTKAREMSVGEVAEGVTSGEYPPCPQHDRLPVRGRTYFRDLDKFLEILAYELDCPEGGHAYLAYETDGG